MDIQGRTERASAVSVAAIYGSAALLLFLSAALLVFDLGPGHSRLTAPAIVFLGLSVLAALAISGVATTLTILPSGELQLRGLRAVTRLSRHQITGHNAPLGNRGIVAVRHTRGTAFFVRSEPLITLFLEYLGSQPKGGNGRD